MNWLKSLFARVAKHKKHYWAFLIAVVGFTAFMFAGVNLILFITGAPAAYTIWMAFKMAILMAGLDLIINIRVDNEVDERMAKIEAKNKFDEAIAERFGYNNQTIKTDSIDEDLEPELNENDNARRV